jgi:hypothetical protein
MYGEGKSISDSVFTVCISYIAWTYSLTFHIEPLRVVVVSYSASTTPILMEKNIPCLITMASR